MADLRPCPETLERFRRDAEAVSGGAPERIGIAVSGGPDSLALLLLAVAAWPGRVEAATVDHGLRPDAGAEAVAVAALCARLGIPHAILHAEVDVTRSSLPRAAREARYRTLAGWMDARGIHLLATAHHADDQAETLLMRLLRGSGVGGLAGVRATGPVPGASGRTLLRPLLAWRRSDLAELIAGAGLKPASDPSNSDPRFDRARLRARLPEADWIDVLPLARSAAALAEADEALSWATERLWRERVGERDGALTLDPRGLPPELVRRLLARIFGETEPRGSELGRLAAALADGRTATLGGIKAEGGALWRFERAPPRRSG